MDNRTRYYNTVSKDNLSATMYAYYFCDKTRQVLSDKHAASLKQMNLESNLEMLDEDNMRFMRGGLLHDSDEVRIEKL